MRTTLFATALSALVFAGCATTASVPPVVSEFGDLPVPDGLKYVPDQSAFIESESVKAARLVYTSSFEPGSLVVAMQRGLEGSGWRLVRATSFPGQGTVQFYEKGEASLQVKIWEGGMFGSSTFLELSGTRATGRAKAATAAQTR